MKRIDSHIVKGMNKDMSVSIFSSEMLIDARNIRIGVDSENSLYTIYNEKGPSKSEIDWTNSRWNNNQIDRIDGTIIGNVAIDNHVVLFVHSSDDDSIDTIYRLDYNKDTDIFESHIIIRGNMGFSIEYPIECIISRESEYTIKVYFIDGINQLRSINILSEDYTEEDINIISSVPNLENKETIYIENIPTGGNFPPGTIQFIFTYVTSSNTETNPFYISSLYYTYSVNRGSTAEEVSTNSFKITINNPSPLYDTIRVYSIITTSEGSYQSYLHGEYTITDNRIIITPEQITDHGIQSSEEIEYISPYCGQASINDNLVLPIGSDSSLELININGDEDIRYFTRYNPDKLGCTRVGEGQNTKYIREYYVPIVDTTNLTRANHGEIFIDEKKDTINIPANSSVVQKKIILEPKNSGEASSDQIGSDYLSNLVIRKIYSTLEAEFEYEMYPEYTPEGATSKYGENDYKKIIISLKDLGISGDPDPDTYYMMPIYQSIFVYNPVHNRLEFPCNIHIETDTEHPDNFLYNRKKGDGIGNGASSLVIVSSVFRDSITDVYEEGYDTTNTENIASKQDACLNNHGNFIDTDHLTNQTLYLAVLNSYIEKYTIHITPEEGEEYDLNYYPINKDGEFTIIGKITKWKWKLSDPEDTTYLYMIPSNIPFNEDDLYSLDYVDTPEKYPVSSQYQGSIGLTDWNSVVDTEFPKESFNYCTNGYGKYTIQYPEGEGHPMPSIKKVTTTYTHPVDIVPPVYGDNKGIDIIISRIGETVDPLELRYKEKDLIFPYTMATKNNVLFLGNYINKQEGLWNLNNEYNINTLNEELKPLLSNNRLWIQSYLRESDINVGGYDSPYTYNIELNHPSNEIKGFKYLETYRLGIQLQDSYGVWSTVIPLFKYEESEELQDWRQELAPDFIRKDDGHYIKYPAFKLDLSQVIPFTEKKYISIDKLKELGYKRVRPVAVMPTEQEREVVAQGVVNPTWFNVLWRYNHQPDVMASWCFRPIPPLNFNVIQGYNKTWSRNNISTTSYIIDVRYYWNTLGNNDVNNWWFQAISQYMGFPGSYYIDVDAANLRINASIDYRGIQRFYPELPSTDQGSSWVTLVTDQSRDIDYTKGTSLYYTGNGFSFKEFNHWNPIGTDLSACGEVQGCENAEYYYCNYSGNDSEKSQYAQNRSNLFYVDCNVVTLNSPDYDSNISTSDLKFRIVGIIPLHGNQGHKDVTTSTGLQVYSNNPNGQSYPGFMPMEDNMRSFPYLGYYSLGAFLGFGTKVDANIHEAIDCWSANAVAIYPFQKDGSLSSRDSNADVLKYNRLSNLRFSLFSRYFVTYNSIYNPTYPAGPWMPMYEHNVTYFDSSQGSLAKVGDLNYYGDVDSMVSCPIDGGNRSVINNVGDYVSNSARNSNGMPIKMGTYYLPENINNDPNAIQYIGTNMTMTLSNVVRGGGFRNSAVYFTNFPRITYKSTPHYVIGLHYGDVVEILPKVYSAWGTPNIWNPSPYWGGSLTADGYVNSADIGNMNSFYMLGLHSTYQTSIPNYSCLSKNEGFLYLGELYREVSNKFNGTSDSALQNNQWVVAGEAVDLDDDTVIEWTEGDTYVQRWDCLKTYPRSTEDTNQVTEILSFMVETRKNLDGRTDRNRGMKDNLNVSPENFNLYNDVYNNSNNFFTYSYLTTDLLRNTEFRSDIVWTAAKSNNSVIDNWMNILAGSSYTVNTSLGSIEKLITFDDNIYCFQEKGLGVLLYDNRSMITPTDGVPIEITSGTAMQGIRYISQVVGCQNKWSIAMSASGIYFMDNNTSSIYLINSNTYDNITDRLGFISWASTQDFKTKWNPYNGAFISYSDNSQGNIYFTNGKEALVYSEKLNAFTSYMDYSNMEGAFSIDKQLFILRDNSIWKLEGGDYNNFFGEIKPYWISFFSNKEFNADKIFDTLTLRGEYYNSNSKVLNDIPFTDIEVSNEYQYSSQKLEYRTLFNNRVNGVYSSNTKRKFRLWGIIIPRDKNSKYGRDRIRNMWAKFTLKNNNPSNNKMNLYTFDVNYSI